MYLLRSGHLYMKDAQCAIANEKSYLRFLVFELLLPKMLQELRKKKSCSKVAKFTGKIRIDQTTIFRTDNFFLDFEM